MEAIAGLSSILQVIHSVTKVAKRLNEVRESYNNVALNTTLVASQLSTIRAALEALYEWRASDRDSSAPSKQLDKDLGMSLSCCAVLISVIDGKLDDSGYMPELKQKIRYLWLEDILKEYISNLEGQVRALQLLLTIFQCRTATEKRQKLANEETRSIMEQVRLETVSLTLDNMDIHDSASVLSLDPSVTLDVDSDLMKSPAYKRVYGHARLRKLPVVSASPVEKGEQAARPVSPLKESLQPPPLPSRPTRKPMPQSRSRINVWDFYPGKEEDHNSDATTMADSRNVFELSGETRESSAASQPNEESKREQGLESQLQETIAERIDTDVKVTGAELSMDRASEIEPLSVQTRETQATGSLVAIDDTESVSALAGFVNQLDLAFEEQRPLHDGERDLGLLYEMNAPLKTEEGYTFVITRDEALKAVSREGPKEAIGYSEPQLADSSLGLGGSKSLQEEQFQKSRSTHSSLYESSIIAVSKEQSTRTSSPYSCVSCRNAFAVEHISEDDRLEAKMHGIAFPDSQAELGSVDVQKEIGNDDLISSRILKRSQQAPLSANTGTPNESQFQASKDILPISPKSTTVEQHTHSKDLTTYSTPPVGNIAKSEREEIERIEMSRSTAGLSLRHPKTPETSDTHLPVTEELPSIVLPTPKIGAPSKYQNTQSLPAVAFIGPAEARNPESEQSTLSSNRGSSAHDATSTTSSSEAPEDRTVLSLQQSTSNTTATSLGIHAPGLNRDQAPSDLRWSQNELATIEARGGSPAVQDSLQRSIAALRRTYLAGTPAEANDTPAKSLGPRMGKARSNLMRFPSLPGSTNGKALGDFAASGNTISVQKILKEKVNVDSRSDNFKTPLMRAALNGHIECMKMLRQSGADEFAVDARGRTVLHLAVATNRLAAVEWLLESYPQPKSDSLKHRPSILLRATDVVKGVRPPKSLREASDAEGSKPLHVAADLDLGAMVNTLIVAGVDMESKDNWGRTPFHRAIISKRRDSFDTLIRSGAKIAAVDANNVSSLHLAAQAGLVAMIETLLANGAKRWDFDARGNQPIHSAVLGGNLLAFEALVTERADFDKRTKSGETLLHLACLKKDLELAKYLLTKHVDVNPWAAPSSGALQILSQTKIKGSSMTPLHYACCTQDFEMAVLLLDHEALVNAPTPEGATALMMAVESEDTNMVNLLLQRGAKVNAKVPVSLITALHLAVRRGDLETVQQLCRHGADDTARTSNSLNSRTPLDESWKCPDKKKALNVQSYLWVVHTNRLKNQRSNARNLQVNRPEPYQPYYNPSGAQTGPLAHPVGYVPRAEAQHGYSPGQEYVAQRAQAQSPQYYHPHFDVPDESLPPYEPGPAAPARFANQAPVHRENYA